MKSRFSPHAFRRGVRIVVGALLLIAAIFLLSWVLIRTFTIKDIVVDAPGMTIQLDSTRFGKNLLFLPVGSLRQELLASYPLLADVRFEKKLPGTLIVHFVQRSTFALLRSAGNTYAIDDSGLVLSSVGDESGFPMLSFDVGIVPTGTHLTDPRVRGSLSLLRALKESSLIRSIEERDSQTLQAKVEHTNIFLPQQEDLSGKADTLQIIIEGFRIKGTLPGVIDLRHEKPIITN